MYYGGVSDRGVGKTLGMNKSNVMNWIKKENEKKEKEPPHLPEKERQSEETER